MTNKLEIIDLFLNLLESQNIKPIPNELYERIERLKNLADRATPHSHQVLIDQCEQDKKNFPEFWWGLWQKRPLQEDHWHHPVLNLAFDSPNFVYRRHPHAEQIIQWHGCSDEQKKHWESKERNEMDWHECGANYPQWNEEREYRLKPRTIGFTLDDGERVEFPEPIREAPKQDETYYLARIFAQDTATEVWKNDIAERGWLNNGLMFRTESDALQALEALNQLLSQRST